MVRWYVHKNLNGYFDFLRFSLYQEVISSQRLATKITKFHPAKVMHHIGNVGTKTVDF